MPKQLEILREAAPVRRLAYLTPDVPSPAPAYPSVTELFERAMHQHAKRLGIDVEALRWRQPADVDGVAARLDTMSVDALYLIESASWFALPRPTPLERLIELSMRRRLPSIAGARAYAEAGLLISYGDARIGTEIWRTVTRFVVRIFRGATPAQIPIERPTRFELVANERTARTIGVALPRSLLERADTVVR
jgi:putative ABC transport system substrate-binding protein